MREILIVYFTEYGFRTMRRKSSDHRKTSNNFSVISVFTAHLAEYPTKQQNILIVIIQRSRITRNIRL